MGEGSNFGVWIGKKKTFLDYKSFDAGAEKAGVSQNKLTTWLKKAAKLQGVGLQESTQRLPPGGKPEQCFKMERPAAPVC